MATASIVQRRPGWRRICGNSGRTMDPQRRSRAVGVGLVLAAALLWSTGGVGIKAVEGPALAVAGWRGLFALPVLASLAAVRVRGAGRAASLPLRGPWSWVGAASYAVMVICFVVATKWTTAANAIFIQYTSPVYVAILSWPLLRERVGWRENRGRARACSWAWCSSSATGCRPMRAPATSWPSSRASGRRGCRSRSGADQRRLLSAGPAGWRRRRASPAPRDPDGGRCWRSSLCAPAMRASPPLDGHGVGAPGRALGVVGQIGLPYVLYARPRCDG